MGNSSKRFFHRREGAKIITLKNIQPLSLNDENNPLSESLPPVVESSRRPSFFNQKFLIIFLFILVFAIGAFLGEKYLVRGEVKLPFISISPKRQTLSNQNLIGKVTVGNSVIIENSLNGRVGKVLVKSGDTVKEGQKLAEIISEEKNPDRDRAYQNYQEGKKNLEAAQIELQIKQDDFFAKHRRFMEDAVARNLPVTDPIYQQEKLEMDRAEAEFKKQQVLVSQKQQTVNEAWKNYQQSFTSLTAPTAGTITELNLIPGEAIPSRVAVIKTGQKTEITFSLPADKAGLIIAETPVEVTFADGTKQIGKVLRVDENGQMIVGLNQENLATFVNTPVAASISF